MSGNRGGARPIADAIAEIDRLGRPGFATRDLRSDEKLRRSRAIAAAIAVDGAITHIEGSNPVSLMIATQHGFQVRLTLTADEAVALADLIKASVRFV